MVGAGVRARVGQRVFIWNGQWKRPFGTAAQYITLPGEQAVHLPDSVSFAEGAMVEPFAVGLLGGAFLVALTAQFALFRYTPVVYWPTLALGGAVAHLLTENLAKVWAIPLTGLTAILAGISMVMALAGTLYPVPAAPYSWLPYLYFVYLLIALLFFFRTRRKRPAAVNGTAALS